ncbi:unnamed protein product [Durusdinium trenchii]|uniref:TIR domain-containing protein n=1 Tax=Durusdinium trenchii TaxID=1381693 RepID=A0ABP0SRD3_9DINO
MIRSEPVIEPEPSRLTSVTSLASVAKKDMVRAVPLDLCLQRWGIHFRTTPEDAAVDNFELSQPCEHIDAFLSHDWKTSRVSKTIALLLIFNSLPASLVALCASLLTSGMISMEWLPGGWMTASAATHAVFFFFLFFWQRLRRLLCFTPAMVFLDRLCIAQKDEHLKQEGIFNLAGILAKSRKLVILWSPRYFTRLWCAFELSTFLKEQMTSFSIKASECTCCALNHCNPATGERLLCDREVVFRTLKRWYEETGEGDHLDHFDSIVQKQLSSSVLQVVGSGAPSRRYVLAMVGTPSLAVWPQYVYLRHSEITWFATKWAIDFWKVPAVALWTFWVLVLSWRTGAALSRRCPMWMVVPVVDMMGCALIGVVWAPYEIVNERYRDTTVLTLSVLLFWSLVLAAYGLVYHQRKCRL